MQKRLQDKGDDPRYARVFFAVDGQDKFVEVNEGDIFLAGVFPRVSGVRCAYGDGDRVLRNVLSPYARDTLVVANNEGIAERWETVLSSLGYSITKV